MNHSDTDVDLAALPQDEGASASFNWPDDIDEHAACAMCYTSGTTGNPKGVLLVP